MPSPTLVWFRQDLRLSDHPALTAALEGGGPVVPVYVWSPEEEGEWAPGGAYRWWLHQSLLALEAALRERGSRLILRTGPAAMALAKLAKETGAERVVWSYRYEPAAREEGRRVRETLTHAGIACEAFHGSLLHVPGQILNGSGKPFQVFTPFWRACTSRSNEDPPLPTPSRLPSPRKWPTSVPLADFRLEPRIDWAAGIREAWTPGEAGARKQLSAFKKAVSGYPEERDRPDLCGSSRLSPHLQHGELSPRLVLHALRGSAEPATRAAAAVETYLRELGWREFAHHSLVHFPHTPTEPLRPEFSHFPWEKDAVTLRKWQRGQTGYPLVDAGMRQLWATGWMHNRVRMVVASFLIKHLLTDWQEGARWFWDTLVDASLANNTLNWQWSAGCGADAAPYFRIFNPTTQAEKFDSNGDYIRRWVPELAELPTKLLHQPWKAGPLELAEAGVELGRNYPFPIVEHGMARGRALAALAQISKRPAGIVHAEEAAG